MTQLLLLMGKQLLSESELNKILAARTELIHLVDTGTEEVLKKAIKKVEQVSEDYVARRMNASVQKVLSGKNIDQVDV